MDDPFKTPQKYIDRAKVNFDAADKAFIQYGKDGAFRFVVEDDPETGDQIHGLKQFKELPVEVEMGLSDALMNLRMAFDQAMYAACVAINRPPKGDINYPWANSPTDLKHRMSKIPEELKAEIIRQKPYPTGEGYSGGDDIIRNVAKLVNDKHTIGFEAMAVPSTMVTTNVSHLGPGGVFTPWDPEKKIAVVARVRRGGAVSYDEAMFKIDVRFKRSSLLGSYSAFTATDGFRQVAQFALNGLKAACAEINSRKA